MSQTQAFVAQLEATEQTDLVNALIEIRNDVIEHLRNCTCNKDLCCVANVGRNFTFMAVDMKALKAEETYNLELHERIAEKAKLRNATVAKNQEAKVTAARAKHDE